jgi:hypothetical protein
MSMLRSSELGESGELHVVICDKMGVGCFLAVSQSAEQFVKSRTLRPTVMR